MTDSTLPFADLEAVYDRIAEGIDQAGPQKESLFLAKLAFSLAHHLGDRTAVDHCIEVALADIDD